jgi:uncharacterized repeat protein (TIGR01451 family)
MRGDRNQFGGRPSRFQRLAAAFTVGALAAASLVGTVLGMGAAPAQAITSGAVGAPSWGGVTYYAYAEAGEDVNVIFTTAASGGASTAHQIRVTNPAGTVAYTCTLGITVGNSCASGNLLSPTAGVWKIEDISTDGGSMSVNWNLRVLDTGVVQTGRIWTSAASLRQTGGAAELVDFVFYMVNDAGYQYRIDLNDYNGVASSILANSLGIANAACIPTYRSQEAVAATGLPVAPFTQDCGPRYRLFFEPPSAALPATAPSPDGVISVLPAPLGTGDLAVTDLAFAPTALNEATGTFTYSIDPRFSGGYRLQIDTDGDGVYGEAVDRNIALGADGSGSYTYVFDGLNGQGAPIADCTEMNARIHFDKVGEVHVLQSDVEGRAGGIAITRTNGPGAPSSTIYWNDSGLANNRTNVTAPLNGTAGVNSAAGVHRWAYDNGSWGNNRVIDDWTYTPVDVATGEITIPGLCLEVTKTADRAEVIPGDTITYTITVENTGGSDYTASNPASVTDDLSSVLDDGEYNGDATGGAIYTAPVLSWSGALAAGATHTVTYSITANDPVTGDQRLINSVVSESPGATCPPGSTDPACTVDVPTSTLNAWTCSPDGLLFQAIGTAPNQNTAVYAVDLITGAYVQTDTIAGTGNAVGYNTTDDYVYGVGFGGQRVVRIGADGTLTDVTPATGWVPATYNVGDFDDAGHYWLTRSTAGVGWLEIDYAQGSPTYGQVISSGTLAPAGITPGSDWVFVDGSLYTINTLGRLIAFDTTTKQLTDLGPVAGLGHTGSPSYGAGYADADGNLYFSRNDTGGIYRVDPDAVTAVLFTNGPASSGNDGARCATAPILLDLGDAPDTYGTTITSSGARHGVSGYDESTGTAPLMLGATIDPELDGFPTPDGLGDDEDALADEDGVTGPILRKIGEQTTVTVTATNNTAAVATLAGWIDLNGNGVFDPAERVTVAVPANSGAATYTLTFAVGTVSADTMARFRLFSGAVADPLPTGPVSGGEVEDHLVVFGDRALEIEKTSTQTADSRPGDVISYTVTATNTGAGDYTVASPAVIFDDLRSVLDDASYNGDVTASESPSPTYLAPGFLSWRGALASGETVTMTYTVTLQAGGDGVVDNVAWQPTTPPPPGNTPTSVPACDPRAPEGTDPVTGEACAATAELLPRLTIDKSASTADLPTDGDSVTYTIVVTNTGPGDFTASAPATFTDDLSDVLDDGAYGGDAAATTGDVEFSSPEILWEGVLAAGESATITYTAVYDASAGNNVLINTVCVPEDDALDPEAACDVVQIPAAALTYEKTVDPDDGTAVVAGQEVTYTLSFSNIGQAPAAVDALDSLEGVLDDADLTTGPTADPGLTAIITGDELAITGEVPVGATLTVTYTVTVREFADQDDHELGNVLSNGDGTCPPAGCKETTNPIRHYAVVKEAATDSANPGDVVTYTVTITNDGAAAYTTDVPASVSDDLSAALDDGTFTGPPTAVVVGQPGIELPVPVFTAPTLSWSGAIDVGQTVEITYAVTVSDPRTGDGELGNTVVPTGPGGECEPGACETATPVQWYSVSKTSSATEVVPGDTVTYTVTVTNGSSVDYTALAPASFTDDLSEVLDDATYNDDATNGATVTGTALRWEGALLAGASITITYTVTVDDPNTGDDVLTNAVVPDGPGGECVPDECSTTTAVQSYTVTKEASATTVEPGDTITYTVTVTNTGAVAYTALDPASFTDDLSSVLDDAAYNADADNGATYSAPALTWSDALAAGASITITYSVTVNAPNTGDGILANAVVPTGTGGDCVGACETTTGVQSYTVAKAASAEIVQLGDTIEYTVVVTNTGSVDYTDADPASFTDDLGEVLDDGTYNDDATNGATVTGDTLAWTGALAAGDSVEITYSVTVNSPNTGDNVLTNAVTPTGTGGECVPDECATVTPVQSFRVTKTANAVDVVPDDVITYTLTITNTGQAAYTALSPATLTDDLTEVLDDAIYNGDATGGATYTEPVLSWSGALAVGETVTVTYSVTVNDPVTGDSQVDNAVVTDNGGNCEPGSDDPACQVNIPAGSYTVSKTASAVSAMPGDVVAYTVTVTNTGALAYTDDDPASFIDELANVLDDATYNDDATQGATVTGTVLSWEGPLAVAETVEITYSVTVNATREGAGDLNLANVVLPTSPGGDCDPAAVCSTDTAVGRFDVAKASSGTGFVKPGDVLTYTITVTNDSEVDFTASDPASFTDDLSDVLDDGTYNDDASGGATVTGTTLSWSGPLAAGATIEITYSITTGAVGSGDGILTNAVEPGDGGACIGTCSTEELLQAYTVEKSSSAGGSVLTGDVVTYTVTVSNVGTADYTAGDPVTFTDDLSAVLDDASYNGDASNGAQVVGTTLSWSGPLAAGASIEITYTVTVLPAGSGDGELTNAVIPTAPGGECDPGAECETTDLLRAFTVEKAASATSIGVGETLTYTIVVTNTGAAPFTPDAPATVSDDLTDVLDDATYNDDASNGAVYAEPVLSWSLSLPAGESVILTYSVVVDDPLSGDLELVNAVDPGEAGECPNDACVTETPIAAFTVDKTVDTAVAGPGAVVGYTITVRNIGAAPYTGQSPASFTDDLTEVLDDAVFNDDATNGATYAQPVLSWEGPLDPGETVSVAYSVTVNSPVTGDRQLDNAVVPGEGGGCDEVCAVMTDIVVPPAPAPTPTPTPAPNVAPLAITGMNSWIVGGSLGVALLAISAGLLFLLIRGRQDVV